MILLCKRCLGFLNAKASVYEPFYTLEVSCLAGCDTDLINATQAGRWQSEFTNLSRGSSLVLNPLHAIHGILATLNSTIPRYHQVSRFFGPRILLHVPRKQVRLASQCDTSESDAASRVVERHGSLQTRPSFTVQLEKQSNYVKYCETTK